MYKRLFCSIPIVGSSLFLAAQSSPAPKNADIDPNAMAALDKMGSYLRTLTTFQVKAVETTDDVLDNGQAVQSGRVIDMLAARPNRMLVEIKSDEQHPFFLYDGKNFTMFASLMNYYATVPAPPTIAELIGKLEDKVCKLTCR